MISAIKETKDEWATRVEGGCRRACSALRYCRAPDQQERCRSVVRS